MLSAKAARFSESVIREMSRVCALEGGVNLARGFPDFAVPEPMKAAACRAIQADGRSLVRFCFAKRRETLERAPELLRERLGGRS